MLIPLTPRLKGNLEDYLATGASARVKCLNMVHRFLGHIIALNKGHQLLWYFLACFPPPPPHPFGTIGKYSPSLFC